MELVYLSNGQACYLKEKIGRKYVVNRIFEYEDEEHGWQEIQDTTNDILVDMVFKSKSKPIEKIATEIKELLAKKQKELTSISELRKQKDQLKYEIEQITKTQISQNKFIVNRTELLNAKTLVLFIKDRIMPITLMDKDRSFRGLTLTLNIELSTGTERSWGYKLYYDSSYSSGDYLCEKYGILINPTEEEVENTIKKRLLEFKFSDYWIQKTDDKYLTPELITHKNGLIQSGNIIEREKLEKILKETQEKLSKLR